VKLKIVDGFSISYLYLPTVDQRLDERGMLGRGIQTLLSAWGTGISLIILPETKIEILQFIK